MKTRLLILCVACLLAASCGGAIDKKYAGFQLEMPDSLLGLVNADAENDVIRVTGGVLKVDAAGNPLLDKFGQPIFVTKAKEALSTIRGHYVIPVSGLKKNRSYRFQLKIYHRANAYAAPAISKKKVESQKSQVEGEEFREEDVIPIDPISITTNMSGCPEPVDFSPDGSLVDGEWLVLCEIDTVLPFKKYDPTDPIIIDEEAIVCTGDADGDGTPNLTEVDSLLDPYNGDYDGDCVKESEDAFPDDPDEWLDTDGDGLGNNEDLDADNDGASDEEEQAAGTDPVDSDSDDDGVIDGSDNCSLLANADQGNVDEDDEGDACDDDSDNDDLTDEREKELGTTVLDADSDDDGLNDGREVDTEGTDPLDSDTDNDTRVDGSDRFPLNIMEWEDTDNDGVGNNGDFCPSSAESTNRDTDGDRTGDACDSDDDNDGVSDSVEARVGSNPLNADTDGDSLTDWFQNGTRGLRQDACLLNATGDHTDADGDGFGVVCDLSDDDDDTVDPSADEINFVAIFVDGASGNDANSGSRAAPVKTLKRALSLADADNLPVYAAGDFAIDETLELANGVTLYGGFASGFSSRQPITGPSEISSASLETLVEADGTTNGAGLDGFSLEISNTLHATAIEANDGTITLRNNEISATGGSGTGTAIQLDGCSGTIANNDIDVRTFGNRFGIACVSQGTSAISLSENRIDLWPAAALENVNLVYVQDCVNGVNRLRYDPSLADPFGSLSGLTDGGGNVLDGIF